MKRLPFFFLLPSILLGSPKGGQVTHGHADIVHHGTETQIETSHHAVIEWDSFSIAPSETMRFVQPHTNSTVINRVHEGMSQIDGALLGNGRIYLLNPNGVLVGKNGIISCAAFAASTLDFDSDACFKGGDLLFKGDSRETILNFGKIKALDGDVFLLARAVINEGTIEAKEGIIGIAAAREVLLKPEGIQRLYIAPQSEDGALLENAGVIEAARAELRADGNVYRLAINQKGAIEATGFREEGGKIVLTAENGRVENRGDLIAESGSIHLLGGDVLVDGTAKVDVSGKGGGGEVLIGGDYQGSNPDILNARYTAVNSDVLIDASAREEGDGGKIIVWGDELASFNGKIGACGGSSEGNGGFVEISSPGLLRFHGLVDVSAERGDFGKLLFDPSDITISNTPNADVNLQNGVWSAFSTEANLNTIALMNSLISANIKVTTKSSLSAPGNITIENSFGWTQATTLTLEAEQDVIIQPVGNVEPSNGSVVIHAGRDFRITAGANLTTDAGSIRINAMRDISIKSAMGVDAFVNSSSGNITLNAKRDISILGILNQKAEISSGGSISINQDSAFGGGRNITLGSSTPTIGANSLTAKGPIRLTCKGNLRIYGSSVNGISEIFSDSGSNLFDIGGDLLLQGGTGTNAKALLGTRNGNLQFQVGGDVEVKGGSANDALAHLGHYRPNNQSSGAGDLRFSEIGGSVRVIGGTATGCDAHIGAVPINNNGDWSFKGDIELSGIREGVEVQSGVGQALIGFGGGPGFNDFQGSLAIDAQKDIQVTANGNQATIGLARSEVTAVLSRLQVQGQNITLQAGNSQDATIGYQSTAASPTSDVLIRNLQVDAIGTVQLNPGTNSDGFNGSSLIGAFSEDGGGVVTNVEINAPSVVVRGSSGTDGGFSRILASNYDVVVSSNVTINTENLDVGFGGTKANSAEMFARNDILVLSEGNVTLRGSSFVHTNVGQLTLVADYNKSDPLEVGDGNFSILAGATLTSAGPLRIFTSTRSSATIDAQLNGVTFVPGPPYVSSATEQWGMAYPDDFGGVPYTLFYKSLVPGQTVFGKNNQIFGEMFQKLHMYDELLFSCKCFLFGYDPACYDQLLHPKGMVSSFDLFSEEEKYMLRQKYRNYELKYVESF